jgi:hypothetical protein
MVGGRTYQPLDYHRTLLLEDLPRNEHRHDGDEPHQQPDDLATFPRMRLSAVLQSQYIRHNQAHHKGCSDEIHLQYLLFQRRFGWFCVFWSAEEDEDNDGRNASDGEIDPETLATVSIEPEIKVNVALPNAR